MAEFEDISVVIPNCGDADVLPRAIRSVGRAAPGAEVIVVDNDGLSGLELPRDRVSLLVVHVDRQPPGHNRNVGIEWASRDFLLFCDADDEVVRVERRLRRLRETGSSVAVGDPVVVDSSGEHRAELGEPEDAGVEYIRGLWKPVVGCPLLRREVAEQVGFREDIDRAQDFQFWAEVFDRFEVEYVPEPVYRYHRHDGNRGDRAIVEKYRAQRRASRRIAMAGLRRYALATKQQLAAYAGGGA